MAYRLSHELTLAAVALAVGGLGDVAARSEVRNAHHRAVSARVEGV